MIDALSNKVGKETDSHLFYPNIFVLQGSISHLPSSPYSDSSLVAPCHDDFLPTREESVTTSFQ